LPINYNAAAEGEQKSTRSAGQYILFDTLAIAGLTLIVKLAGTAKSVVAARYFGAGDALDCYLIAFLIPSFLSDVLAGAINPALVPSLIDAAERYGNRSVQAVYGHALYRGTLLLSIAGCVALVCSDALLRVLGSGFSASKLSLAHTLMVAMLPILPLSAIGVVWRSVLNAQGRFIAAAVSPVLTPIVIIAFLAATAEKYGALALAAGTTAGCVAELCLLAVSLRFANIPIFPAWRSGPVPDAGMKQQYASIVISNLALGGSGIVNQSMAAMLGPGSVSVLALGSRAVSLLLTIGPAALMVAILPRLAKMTALDQWFGLRRTVRKSMLVSMAGLAIVSAILFVFSKPIVQLVFQRGEFSAADTLAVAHLQALLVLQLPFVMGSAILMRVIVLLKLRQALIYVSISSVLLTVALNEVFTRHHGVAGIAIATTVGQVMILIALTLFVFRLLSRMCRERSAVN
jgi:putative peptidoglycan lipid II flippase